MEINIKDIVVYTVLIGEHEGLNEQPQIKFSKLKHFCFTDDINLKSDCWEMVYVSKLFPQDPHRSQRNLKIRPHYFLKDYKYSLYIDNTIVFKDTAENFIKMIIKDKKIDDKHPNIFLPFHSFRIDLMSEFKECINLKRDTQSRIYEQLNDYLKINPEYMKHKPYWGGIIFRNHNNKELIKFSEIWFANICRYSKRDQLSLIHSAYQANIKLTGFYLENSFSNFHIWPIKKRILQVKTNNILKIIFKKDIIQGFKKKLKKIIFNKFAED